MDIWAVAGIGATLVAAGVGAAIGSRQKNHMVVTLSRRINLILRALEEAGLVQVTKDARGEILGLVITGSARMEGEASMSVRGTVERPS